MIKLQPFEFLIQAQIHVLNVLCKFNPTEKIYLPSWLDGNGVGSRVLLTFQTWFGIRAAIGDVAVGDGDGNKMRQETHHFV